MHHGTYDVAVMVIFLFQMVFMDTTTTIVTGTCCERWKYSAFMVSTMFLGAFTYPIFANWAWGGGWLAMLGANFGLGHGYADFAGSGVVHSVGGITALACALILGPRIGKYTRDGKANAIPGHDIMWVLCGCFILAFGWFGFNPGSTLALSGNGGLRAASVAVNTMLAGMTGSFGGILYMWIRYGKPDASMSGNAFLAGLVAITAPSGFVNPVASAIIGLVAGVLVCLSCEFVERVLKVDDPVGAISVHGANGIWGVIAVGLFSDGKSNYGGSWNGVAGNVTGLFYGDAGQLVAQLMGVATLLGFVFVMSFVLNLFVDWFVGQRVSAKTELARSGHSGNGRGRLPGLRPQSRSGHGGLRWSSQPCPQHSTTTDAPVSHDGGAACPRALAGPSYGPAGGAGGEHRDAGAGVSGRTAIGRLCAPASAWRTR